MSKNTNPFELPDLDRIFKNLSNAMDIINKTNKALSVMEKMSGVYAALEAYQSISQNAFSNDIFEKIIKNAETVQSIFAKYQVSTAFDLASKIDKALPWIEAKPYFPTIDWDWMSKTLNTYENCNDDEIDDLLTTEVCEELNESVQEILCSNDSDNLAKSKFLEFQSRHPVLAFMLLSVLLSVLINIVSGFIYDWVSGTISKKTNVYEEPTSTSNVVIDIDVEQNVTIVNKVPYYYEIEFIHPETGEKISGYIYKPNISISYESDETFDVDVSEDSSTK